mgnify:CR=1 FL=1
MSFLRLSNFHILFVFGIFLYVLGILIFNADRGLDVTDESFYILNAMYPFDVFSVITHENYYTGLLFYLSGYNLAIFRVFGIIVLLLSSLWFALELYKYIVEKYELNYNNNNKLYFILIISLSSLVYYSYWLLTPSYNWLSLVAMLLTVASMFRAINSNIKIKNRLFALEYIYLGFSLSLLFMSKPTSLLGLFPGFLFFIFFNYKKIDLIKSFISVSIVFFTLILFHIIFLDGGFSSYIYRFNESMDRISLIGGGHGIKNSLIAFYQDAKNIFKAINRYKLATIVFVLFFIIIFLKNKNKLLSLFIYLFIFLFGILLYKLNVIPFSVNEKIYLQILIFSFFVILIYFFIEDSMKERLKIFFNSFLLFLFLSYLSLAVSFGTGNNIWFHSGIAYFFPVAALMSFVFIFDKYHSMIKNMKIVVGILISLSVITVINNAYKNPYRLNTSVKEQTEKVDLLGGIKVDEQQKIYIDSILNSKRINLNTNENIYLIDTTGATPGANVILGAKFFGQSWLLGGYKGSNEFAYRILSSISYDKLKKAWVLTSPNGSTNLDLNLFNKLGLKFPEDYDKVTTLFLNSRNEIQELWKPKEIFNDK